MKKSPETQKDIKTIDLQKAIQLADRANLQNVRLIAANCLLRPSGLKGPYEIDISHSTNIQINKEKKVIVVLPTFALVARVVEKKGNTPDYEISASFALSYSVESFEGLKEENFYSFGEANGIYNAWPYWREFVQSTTSRMGISQLTVPVFRIASLNKDDAKKASGKKGTTKKKKKVKAKN